MEHFRDKHHKILSFEHSGTSKDTDKKKEYQKILIDWSLVMDVNESVFTL